MISKGILLIGVSLRRKSILKIPQRSVRCPFSSVQCGLNTSYEPVGGLGSNEAKQSKARPFISPAF